MGLFEKPQQSSDDAVASDDPEAMNNLGRLAYQAGDLEGARAWWEKAAKLDHPEAMTNLGVLAKEAGDMDVVRVRKEPAWV